ncbi:MAG: glycoside hydrolase family 5 protein [Nanoarchaeota archaeon]|nr:glycoside hydrolase family 5 protein [Nanoarchaeota archaeon]MBU1445199.1 glycoside hydrolase family 5 protein [Nanoarchaeota archaeon]MBU2406763.1 glycoside hydrolase family 5 protein [Nanoarchaeota archaeon]MBU2420283.1 glycoside hydrolase family 5 protein [Nanoarchaeota archaeon]MBU2475321.1 glycoside hydrolase family 5 protein [Nanoarchaeota archaeon]
MDLLHTEKNLIFNEKGNEINFKGVSIADPFWIKNVDKLNPLDVVKKAKTLGSNIIRVPIHPGYWRYEKNYLKKYIDPVVSLSQKLKLYLLLDWHPIGNPKTNETRRNDKIGKYLVHDVNLNLAKKALKEISGKYQKRSNVIYEIFNEPAPGDNPPAFMKIKPLYWKDWKPIAEDLVEVVRKENPFSLIVVGGTKWAYDLSKVRQNPVNKENIVYAVHPYPIHKDWDKAFGRTSKKYPVLVTEFGFKKKTREKFMRGTKTGYAKPIFKYLKKHKIGWIAWCFNHKWGPRMLDSWEPLKYTEWGQIVKEELKNK